LNLIKGIFYSQIYSAQIKGKFKVRNAMIILPVHYTVKDG